MPPITDPISASSAGNLVSQQSVTSKQTNSNKNSLSSDSTSSSIGDTLETSDREADGRQTYQATNQPAQEEPKENESPLSGNQLDLHG